MATKVYCGKGKNVGLQKTTYETTAQVTRWMGYKHQPVSHLIDVKDIKGLARKLK